MNLWDSVQRGLEKATHEAGRMAKTQRLRSTIDNLSREINLHHGSLVGKTMDLFSAGQLTQAELLPICQELANLQQQFLQAQNELKQLQASAPQTAPPPPPPGTMPYMGTATPAPYPPAPVETGGYAPPPPGYAPYTTSGSDVTPPPPPGMEGLTVSQLETMALQTSLQAAAPGSEKRRCPACGTELAENFQFCQNCGAPIQEDGSTHSPTVRSGLHEQPYANTQEGTIRAEGTENPYPLHPYATGPDSTLAAHDVLPPKDEKPEEERNEGV